MARFDVFKNDAQSSKRFPFLLSVQSELLEPLATCVVVPLGRATVVANRPTQTLTPTLDVNGEALVMYTPEIAAVYANMLRKRICSLEGQRDVIVRALDFLFSGI